MDRFDALTVPKQWFLWFYVVGLAWTLVLLLSRMRVVEFAMRLVCLQSFTISQFTPWPLFLYSLHLLRRVLEEWYAPPSTSQMHVLGFLVGGTFYAFAPLALGLANISLEQSPPLTHNLYVAPLSMFLLYEGTVHQYICHGILRTRIKDKGRDYYAYPRGDWFRWSSNPHYCAEILIYVGFYLLLPTNNYTSRFWLLTVLFTVLNLCITGYKTHAWYVERFGQPYVDEHRSRVVPLIF